MIIKFKDGTIAKVIINHTYSGIDTLCLKQILTDKKRLEGIRYQLVHNMATRNADLQLLIEWIDCQLAYYKDAISEIRRRVNKTHITLVYEGVEFTSFSKISKKDAALGLHNRKIGRETAIRNLLEAIAVRAALYSSNRTLFPKQRRQELARILLPNYVK